MSTLAEATTGVLEPYVGDLVANMCVRAGAHEAGVDPQELEATDCEKYLSVVASILRPLAPPETVGSWLAEIQRRALL